MAQEAELSSYGCYDSTGERIAEIRNQEQYHLRPITHRSTASRSSAPHAMRLRNVPDDPLPLFLAQAGDKPPQEDAVDLDRESIRDRTITSSLIFRTGLLGVAVAAIAFGLLSAQTPLPLLADAKASLPVATASKSSHPAGLQASPTAFAAAVSPTHAEMVAAFVAAHQSQTEIQSPAPATLPARKIDADEVAALLKRAKGLIAVGDIAPARLLLERAADAQEPGAALLLAQTYDPAVLGTPDARSIIPDPATARGWYLKAAQLGSPDAQQRLAQLGN